MIFVPCENGISHNEIENATEDDRGGGLRRAAARDRRPTPTREPFRARHEGR